MVLALAAAGALPPLILALLPGGLSMLESPGTGVALVAALLFAPALAGFTAALQGLDTVRRRLRGQAAAEHRPIIARVLLDAVILGYVFGLVVAARQQPAAYSCLLVAAVKLAVAWLFLLNIIVDPRPSPIRRHVALAADMSLLSALLTIGGPLTAPLAPIYIYHAIGHGEDAAPRGSAIATGFAVVSFAVVAAITPFWREAPLTAAGTLAAVAALPAYVGWLLRRSAATKQRAERESAAKSRALAAFVDDLRRPLRQIAQARPDSGADPFPQIRSSARGMLLQLDGLLNYVRLDDGSTTPETRSFDLYQVVNGAVASLKTLAAERGITLNLRIDPTVPPQLHGWPRELRQLLISLMIDAIHDAAHGSVRVNVGAASTGAGRATVQIAVSGNAADDQLEPTVSDAAGAARDVPAMPLAARLAELMDGRMTVETDRHGGRSLAVELPFAVDATALPLDLAWTPVLIVTGDSRFARELGTALDGWRAVPRWIGTGESALRILETEAAENRTTALIVDGRYDLLPSLGWAHRAAGLRTAERPLYLIFVAEDERIDSVIGLADGELDSILAAPFPLGALRGAFHGLEIESVDNLSAATGRTTSDRPSIGAFSAEAPVPETPLRTVPEQLPLTPSARPVRERRRHILIASDSAANRRIIRSILAQAGHAVHVAETVAAARHGLEAHAIDVLLLDLTGAPGADYEAARSYRRTRPGLTIIGLTKDAAAEAQRRAREIGLDAIVPKPVEPQQLLAFIEATIKGGAPASVPFDIADDPLPHWRRAGESSPAVND